MTERRERMTLPDYCVVALFSLILVIILLAVFFRYVINHSLFWSDEVVRYLFVWFTLLGAALALRDRRHIRVEYFVERMPVRLRRFLEATGFLLITAFHLYLVVAGTLWVAETRGAVTPALGLPVNMIFYAALPATASLGIYFAYQRYKAGAFAELDAGEGDELPD